MDRASFRPKAYSKEGCPYSFKYLLFMTESGLLNQVDMVRCDSKSAGFDAVSKSSASRRDTRPLSDRRDRRRNDICRTLKS